MGAAHNAGHGHDMTDGGHGGHGAMEIRSHKAMFSGFLKTVEWSCVLLAMAIGLLVFAFAMNLGWWTGLAVWALVGVLAGALLNMGGAWWVTLVGSTVVLAIGGAVTQGIVALT